MPIRKPSLPIRAKRFAFARARALELSIFAVTLVAISSCGSKTTSSRGTSGSGGSPGSPASGQCAAGDTRLCVGPGACSGAQACEENGHWSSCDCGSAGQTVGPNNAGSAGMSAGGAATGGSIGQGGRTSDTAGDFGVGGAEADAGSSGGHSGDEDCPEGPIAVDCSKQCLSSTPSCSDQCGNGTTILDSVTLGTTLIRLPSHPGLRCACSGLRPPAAYSVSIGWHNPPSGTIHVSVPPPWSLNIEGNPGCALPYVSSCQSMGPNVTGVLLTTSDPEAPAVNVTIAPGECPCTSEPCP